MSVNMHKENGFSLIEVLVATVIFGLIILGLVSVFVAGKRHVLNARERMIGAQLGKFFVDPLQMDVRQDNWGQAANIFTAGGSAGPETINNTPFTATYGVADVTGTDVKRMLTTITWPDPVI